MELGRAMVSEIATLAEMIIANHSVSAWNSLNLSGATLASLARLRFSTPTAIQKAAIPDIKTGHDVIGKAPTGSGKTLAFGIPIYERFLITRHVESLPISKITKLRQNYPTALILSPTRELAHQLSTHLTDLCSDPTSPIPSVATVTGGLSVHKQQRLLAHADIIVGTPGRLWEVISGSAELSKSLKFVKFLVVDEADRLLSEGHFKEVVEILRVLDREDEARDDKSADDSAGSHGKQERQTLVFSATFQKDLQQKLAGKSKSFGGDLMGKKDSMEYLLKNSTSRNKAKVRRCQSDLADGLGPQRRYRRMCRHRQGKCILFLVIISSLTFKRQDLYLYTLLLHHPNMRTLIFTNSITSVRRLTPFLQNLNLPAQALHSQMPQKLAFGP